MNCLAPRNCVPFAATLCVLSAGALGCTTMTIPTFPDAGPLPDSGLDAGPARTDSSGFPPPVVETCTPERMGSTLGDECTANAGCDDGCFCNGSEVCEGGTCVAGADPCVDTVDCTADVCLEEANRCFHEPQHRMCTNGDACDGTELCDTRLGCVAGAPPYCNDENSCTIDSCDAEMGCVFQARDLDGDGFTDGRCGGEDCDDDPRFGTMIYPGATEDCMNRRDDDCDGMRDYNDTDCRPMNDTCASAVVLPGAGTYSGSTSGLVASYTLSCRAAGPDAVFRFALTEPHDVQVTVSGGGTAVAVALRAWSQCATGPDEKCNAGSPPTLLRRSLPAGEYAIIVQSSGAGAPFDLNLRITDPTPIPPVDTCNAGTQDLCGGAPCTTVTGATFPGMFVEVEDDYSLSCSSSGRRDAAYRFTIDSPKDVTLTATTTTSGYTYLALTTNCSSTSGELRCIASSYAAASTLRQRELPPGTYYVLVESSVASTPGWNLNVTITDPVPRTAGDACSNPIDISEATPGGGGSGMVSASLLELDTGTSCGGSTTGYRDATFRFTLTETRDVTLTTSASGSTQYVSLRSTCGSPSTDLRCWSGSGTLGQSWRSLPAGTYYVTVSTTSTTATITANLTTGPPTPVPPNDRCPGAITLVSGTSRRDTTIGFEDDATGGSCATGSRPDAFYTFTLAARSTVIISVSDADGGSTQFYLTLRRNPCATGTQVACQAGSPSTINTVLDPGTYFLQVETNATDTSDYNIFPTFFASP